MSLIMKKHVWLIGASQMAVEYAKVLKDLGVGYIVIGRGENSARSFKEKTGVDVIIGGLNKFLLQTPQPATHAIVSSGIEQLGAVTNCLLSYGVKNVLVEKPGGLTYQDIVSIEHLSREKKAKVYIAYNRRFYSSVIKAKDIIKDDGGITSFHFEFTEWAHVIENTPKLPEIKSEWFIANSTHVVDTAFYLGGMPEEWSAYTSGELSWHTPAVFTGAGSTNRNALFSYCANWGAPGRWGVELMTRKHRLYLKPMETLQIQNIGSVILVPVDLDDELDKKYKPGLYLQTKDFIEDSDRYLCPVKEQKECWEIYMRMKGRQ